MPPAPSGPTPSPCRLSTRPPGLSDVERAAGWTSSAPCCVAPGCCQSQGRGGTLDHCRRRPCLLLFLLPAFLEAAEVSLRDFFIASAYVVSLRAEVSLTSVCRRMRCHCESDKGGGRGRLFISFPLLHVMQQQGRTFQPLAAEGISPRHTYVHV